MCAANRATPRVFAFSDITRGIFEWTGLPPYYMFSYLDEVSGQEEITLVFHTSDTGFGATYPPDITVPDADGYYFATLKKDITDKRNTDATISTTLETGNIIFPDNQRTLVKVPKFIDVGMRTLNGTFGSIENALMRNIFFSFDEATAFENRCEYIKILDSDPANPDVWRAYFARKLIFSTNSPVETNPSTHIRGYNLRIRIVGGSGAYRATEINNLVLSYKVMSALYRKRSVAVAV